MGEKDEAEDEESLYRLLKFIWMDGDSTFECIIDHHEGRHFVFI